MDSQVTRISEVILKHNSASRNLSSSCNWRWQRIHHRLTRNQSHVYTHIWFMDLLYSYVCIIQALSHKTSSPYCSSLFLGCSKITFVICHPLSIFKKKTINISKSSSKILQLRQIHIQCPFCGAVNAARASQRHRIICGNCRSVFAVPNLR